MSEEVSQAVREDWDNREFTDQLKLSIGQLFEFLARFGEWSPGLIQFFLLLLLYHLKVSQSYKNT
jgi:hypothetical protein